MLLYISAPEDQMLLVEFVQFSMMNESINSKISNPDRDEPISILCTFM